MEPLDNAAVSGSGGGAPNGTLTRDSRDTHGEGPDYSWLAHETRRTLERWRRKYRGRIDAERRHLWLFALEREQIVAIAYGDEALAARIDRLPLPADVKQLVRQTLVWIWKDEEQHVEYVRGLAMKARRPTGAAVIFGRQLMGAVSGWVSATRTSGDRVDAPLRVAAATALVAAARLTRRISPTLARELKFRTFRAYCELNEALEHTAELSYRRIIDIARTPDEAEAFERIRSDEARHGAAFRIFIDALQVDDQLREDVTAESLATTLGELSPWFLPGVWREVDGTSSRSSFGTNAPVAVAHRPSRRPSQKADHHSDSAVAAHDDDGEMRDAALLQCLDAAGIGAMMQQRPGLAAIRTSFMLGYDRRDRSNTVHPAVVDRLARYLRDHGATDVAVLESPNIYGRFYANRGVTQVAEYLGYRSDAYRLVDISQDQEPFPYDRGFIQRSIPATWRHAPVRIIASKLRTDPSEFAQVSISSFAGMATPVADSVFADRQLNFRTATMMMLDAAPPDAAVVDAWAPVADGPFGVMGCHRPARVRRIYAGSDALAVDRAVLGDLGLADPRASPIIRLTAQWFGLTFPRLEWACGGPAPMGEQLRGPHRSRVYRALGAIGVPIYMYVSRDGELFVPPFDEVAFPDSMRPPLPTRIVRRAAQQVFGIRPPATDLGGA